jgi:hypothetical protein
MGLFFLFNWHTDLPLALSIKVCLHYSIRPRIGHIYRLRRGRIGHIYPLRREHGGKSKTEA